MLIYWISSSRSVIPSVFLGLTFTFTLAYKKSSVIHTREVQSDNYNLLLLKQDSLDKTQLIQNTLQRLFSYSFISLSLSPAISPFKEIVILQMNAYSG